MMSEIAIRQRQARRSHALRTNVRPRVLLSSLGISQCRAANRHKRPAGPTSSFRSTEFAECDGRCRSICNSRHLDPGASDCTEKRRSRHHWRDHPNYGHQLSASRSIACRWALHSHPKQPTSLAKSRHRSRRVHPKSRNCQRRDNVRSPTLDPGQLERSWNARRVHWP